MLDRRISSIFSKIQSEHELDQLPKYGRVFQIGLCHAPEFFEYHFSANGLFWMSFPEIGQARDPEIWQ